MRAIVVTQSTPELMTILNFLADCNEIVTIMDTGRSLFSWWDWFISGDTACNLFLYLDPKINVTSFSDLFTPSDLRLLISRVPLQHTLLVVITSPESFDMYWMYKPVELSVSGSMHWDQDYIVSKSLEYIRTEAEIIVVSGRTDAYKVLHKLESFKDMVEHHGFFVSFGKTMLLDNKFEYYFV